MAQVNVTIAGASYPSVPSIEVPKTGGGTASFVEVSDTTAVATDVAQGKYFYNSSGVLTEGSSSGASAITIHDTVDEHGGTIREITAVDISPTTATADDVKTGKVFFTSSGTMTVGTFEGETMTILSYGKSTWDDFINAYNTNSIVYCRASSNSNPASGSQTRLAFMAYVNNETTPTNVEFQYYRSVSTHSDSQQGDQVYVYKLDKSSGWSVIVRQTFTKIVAGTGLTSNWSNGVLTISLA